MVGVVEQRRRRLWRWEEIRLAIRQGCSRWDRDRVRVQELEVPSP